MDAEIHALRDELAETRHKLAEALARIDALLADKTSLRIALARIERESGQRIACEIDQTRKAKP